MASSKELEIEDFNDWFNEIIYKADLADMRYNIKGLVVFRPWSVFSMSKMFQMYEAIFNNTGHQQVILPTLIPEENFIKEQEHVEGFTPEVFWVTEHGSEKFENKYALRPTSETVFNYMFKYWLSSYRDLPMKTYQRANIFRYETKATKPFLRSREFYWYEAHNIFETFEDAYNQVIQDMEMTEDMVHKEFGVPFIFFKRPQWDKFAGAVDTFGSDTILPNGKLLQIPSTHLLGQGFTKSFDVKYKNANEEDCYPYGTCYGPCISRIYGGMISVHGDKLGIRMPFSLAPVQIIIVPLYFTGTDIEFLEKTCLTIAEDLDKLGYRVKIDDQKEKKPKERFTSHEIKGVPIRIEVGPKDIESNTVTIYRRDLNTKEVVSMPDLFDKVDDIAEEFTQNIREQADSVFLSKTISVDTYDELKEQILQKKVVRIPFCTTEMDGKPCADQIKADTAGGEVRGVRMDLEENPADDDVCVVCKRKAKVFVYVGKSY